MSANLKKLLGDERVAMVAARVEIPNGEESQWSVSDEGQLTIHVRTLNHNVPINVLVDGGDLTGNGWWRKPDLDVGTEVMVGFDNGDFEGDAYLIGVYGKNPFNPLVAGRIYGIAQLVEIRSAGGSANQLATKADVQAVVDALNAFIDKYKIHTHPEPDGTTDAPADTSVGYSQSPVGTQVLKAE